MSLLPGTIEYATATQSQRDQSDANRYGHQVGNAMPQPSTPSVSTPVSSGGNYSSGYKVTGNEYKSPNPYKEGSSNWWTYETAARDQAARANTIQTPVTKSGSSYSSYIAPPVSPSYSAPTTPPPTVKGTNVVWTPENPPTTLPKATELGLIKQQVVKPDAIISSTGEILPQSGLPKGIFFTGQISKGASSGDISAVTNVPWIQTLAITKGMNVADATKLENFVRSTPILSSIATGGDIFLAEQNLGYQSKVLEESGIKTKLSDYEKRVSSYQTNVSTFKPELEAFNLEVSEYEKTKGTMLSKEAENRYTYLSAKEEAIKSKIATLNIEGKGLEKTGIALDLQLAPLKLAETKYESLRTGLVGTEPNEKMATYSITKPFSDISESFTKAMSPVTSYSKNIPIVKDIASGAVGAASFLISSPAVVAVGGERIVKNISSFPALATYGLISQGKSAVENPVEFGTQLVVTAGILKGAGATYRGGVGMFRTVGSKYIPIEKLGYEPELGYPLGEFTPSELRTSFEKSTLTVTPQKMSLTQKPAPYIPESTALPHEVKYSSDVNVPPKTYMWSSLPKTPLKDAIKQFSTDTYAVKAGTSGLTGMYGAPVLETYFAKSTGGGISSIVESFKNIGVEFGSPLSVPTAIRTELMGIESIPKSVSATRSIPVIEKYVGENVPAGHTYMPFTKLEYETILPAGNVVEITGSKYYTKVGGIKIGEQRIFSTRLPIVEQRVTGVRITQEELVKGKTSSLSLGGEESYKAPKTLSAYNLAVSSGLSRKSYSSKSIGYSLSSSYRTTTPYNKTLSQSYKVVSPSKTTIPSYKTTPSSGKTIVPSYKPVSYSSKPVVPSYKTTPSSEKTIVPSYKPVSPSYKPVTPSYKPVTPSGRTVVPSYKPTAPSYKITTPSYKITPASSKIIPPVPFLPASDKNKSKLFVKQFKPTKFTETSKYGVGGIGRQLNIKTRKIKVREIK